MKLRLMTIRRSYTNVLQARNCYGRPRKQFLVPRQDDFSSESFQPLKYLGNMYLGFAARCDAHMNELPVPCIPWQPWYKNKQNLYNKILAMGAMWFLFSFSMMLWTNSVYLNWKPPPQPGPPSDVVEECDDSD